MKSHHKAAVLEVQDAGSQLTTVYYAVCPSRRLPGNNCVKPLVTYSLISILQTCTLTSHHMMSTTRLTELRLVQAQILTDSYLEYWLYLQETDIRISQLWIASEHTVTGLCLQALSADALGSKVVMEPSAIYGGPKA